MPCQPSHAHRRFRKLLPCCRCHLRQWGALGVTSGSLGVTRRQVWVSGSYLSGVPRLDGAQYGRLTCMYFLKENEIPDTLGGVEIRTFGG